MLHHIEEPCSLGAHAGVIVPPTWIVRVRRPQVSDALLLLSHFSLFLFPSCNVLRLFPLEFNQVQQEEKETLIQEKT